MVTEASHCSRPNEIQWGRHVSRVKHEVLPVYRSENYIDRYLDKYEQSYNGREPDDG